MENVFAACLISFKSKSVIFEQKVSPVYAGTSALSLGVFHACLLHPADIDECLEYGTCPQACKNTKGSYDCDCALGYRKVGTGNQCEAEGRIEIVRNHKQECLSMCRILNLLFFRSWTIALLPENIRIRRYTPDRWVSWLFAGRGAHCGAGLWLGPQQHWT